MASIINGINGYQWLFGQATIPADKSGASCGLKWLSSPFLLICLIKKYITMIALHHGLKAQEIDISEYFHSLPWLPNGLPFLVPRGLDLSRARILRPEQASRRESPRIMQEIRNLFFCGSLGGPMFVDF